MTPSPRSRKGSMSGEPPSPSPSQILFTHEEIVVLKLLFSLFDRGGKARVWKSGALCFALTVDSRFDACVWTVVARACVFVGLGRAGAARCAASLSLSCLALSCGAFFFFPMKHQQ